MSIRNAKCWKYFETKPVTGKPNTFKCKKSLHIKYSIIKCIHFNYFILLGNVCSEEVNTYGNTTNLTRHCEKKHNKEWCAPATILCQPKILVNDTNVLKTPLRRVW